MKRNGSMLDPTINELKAKMNNRYLLVNVAAHRAREIAQHAEDEEISLENKPVTIALHEIADGELSVVPEEPKQEAAAEEVKPAKKPSLKSMKKAQLIEFAKENNIEIDEKATNAVMIETIEAALK